MSTESEKKPVDNTPAPPHGRYRRAPRGANFSLEANTESVPADGRFYILVDGKITLESEEFGTALEEYNRLCRDYWTPRLEDEDIPTRVAASWGVLTLNPNDKTAIDIIQRFGTAQEKKRLEQAQSRRRALRARGGG